MVLSKADFDKVQKESFDENFISVSQIIDTRLSNGILTISTKVIKDIIEHKNVENFIDFLIKKYQEAGWKVTRNHGNDWRDGCYDYLQFS
jgi:hypothetical protein